MFNYESESEGFSGALFLAQLVLAPLQGLIVGMVLLSVLEEMLLIRHSNVLGYTIFALDGFLFGYKLQCSIPRAIQSGGCWIWTLPFGVMLWSLYSELTVDHPSAAFMDQFWPGSGNVSGIALMVFFILPAVAVCFYSLGIGAADRTPTSTWEAAFRRLMSGRNQIGQQPERGIGSF